MTFRLTCRQCDRADTRAKDIQVRRSFVDAESSRLCADPGKKADGLQQRVVAFSGLVNGRRVTDMLSLGHLTRNVVRRHIHKKSS